MGAISRPLMTLCYGPKDNCYFITADPKRTLTVLLVAASGWAAPILAQERWTEYTDVRGTRVEYPQHVFSERRGAEGGGQVFARRHAPLYRRQVSGQ